ncbi:chemotaxis protein CheW [Gemmata sp. G18]|uniref:Chemotaxis protein CheW n=1 Tax=Gemmata palustris TaxID=2822762 RepID=A0ABS5BSM4_9BACT|nr:chemotaxis protein CheW [Gemmata palustris]MBP3956729.1 chemotaxis protein CheW [Gemmata palustris]
MSEQQGAAPARAGEDEGDPGQLVPDVKHPIPGAAVDEDIELVTCVLGGVEFGLDINAVQEIVRLPKITPVPRAPGYVEGVANLRGNLLPIINSRARFGLPGACAADSNRVVVVELNGHPTGLIVDAVREVMHVKRRDVEDAPAAVQSVDARFLKGVVKLNGGQRLVLLLDHNSILESPAQPTDAGAAPGATAGERPAAAAGAATEEHEHLVTFRIWEEEYGIPIMEVQEIIRVPNISTIPNAPAGVVGIASLRNRILPVVDLRTKFGLRPLKAELEAFCIRMREFERVQAEIVEKLRLALSYGGHFDQGLLRASRDFERGQEGMATSDRLLQSLVAPVREALKDATAHLRAAVALLGTGDALAARHEADGPLRRAHARLADAFEKMYVGVARRDDERCLVVSVNGISLALRVDAVNQVLQAPRSSVEGPPEIVAGTGDGRDQLRGIAKLNEGKRLIMLLAVDKLVTRLEATSMKQLTDRAADAGERGRAVGGGESDERQLVTFKVANEEFAVDIMQVQEIIRLEKVTKVPHVPAFVEGVVNLRGNVLPVIDLRKRVHLASKEYSDATRVVVMDFKGVKTGIIVDAVSEVMRVHGRDIEPAPAIVRSRYGDNIIEGVGKLDKGDRMFLLLRAEELLKSDGAPTDLPA